MILDQIEHAESYTSLHPRIAIGLRFLIDFKLETFMPGRQEIDGNAVFALLQEYDSKPRTSAKWESHRRYVDIHLICKGEECIGYAPRASLLDVTAYNPQEDYALHEGNGQYLHLRERWFAIFFPQDAHMPGIKIGQETRVRKIVLKVEL